MWLLVVGGGVVMVFAWTLCRAAGTADRMLEQSSRNSSVVPFASTGTYGKSSR